MTATDTHCVRLLRSMHATNRRQFLRRSLTAAAGAAAISAPSSASQLSRTSAKSVAPSRYVRVRGRVRAGTRGIPNVAISDGLAVVTTDANGDFDLTTAREAFVRCSIPG